MFQGLVYVDYIECAVMCLFMIYTSWPELKVRFPLIRDVQHAAEVLVLGIPDDLAQEIRTLVRRISMTEGVIEVTNVNYWIESPGCLVGAIKVQAHRSADREHLFHTIESMCSNTFQNVTIQISKDPSLEWVDKWVVCWNQVFIQLVMEISISDTFKDQIWLVAFDMDQTSLNIHTSGVVVKDNETVPPVFASAGIKLLKAKEVLDHVKESVKVIIPALLKNGIAVAICTNTDPLMASHSSLMGGRELVEYIFGNTFDSYPDICDHLVIEAWRGTVEAVRVSYSCRFIMFQACGKNNHLARVWERMDSEYQHYPILNEEAFQNQIRSYTGDYFQSLTSIDPMKRQAMISHTLLIDDDAWNVDLARRAGYMAFKVKETGLEIEDWGDIVKAIEEKAKK